MPILTTHGARVSYSRTGSGDAVLLMARYDAMWRLRCLGSIGTLVVSGGQDRIAKPEYGRALAAAIPGAAYVEVAHAGHAVPIETPWIVNRLLNEHLRDATRRVAS